MTDRLNGERRSYSRFRIDISAVAYCDGVNHEIRCIVRDISERGLCITADVFDGWKEFLVKGRAITVQFVDEFPFGRGIQTEVVSVECNIRHVREKDGALIIGCYAGNGAYAQYVKLREAGVRMGKRSE